VDRRLVSVIRSVPAEERHRYGSAWKRVVEAATLAGARAWRFASIEGIDHIEFLEFRAGNDPRDNAGVAKAIAGLELIAPGIVREWVET